MVPQPGGGDIGLLIFIGLTLAGILGVGQYLLCRLRGSNKLFALVPPLLLIAAKLVLQSVIAGTIAWERFGWELFELAFWYPAAAGALVGFLVWGVSALIKRLRG